MGGTVIGPRQEGGEVLHVDRVSTWVYVLLFLVNQILVDFIVVVGQKFAHKSKEPLIEVWKKSNHLGYNLSLLKGQQPDENETNTCPQRGNIVRDLQIGKYTVS